MVEDTCATLDDIKSLFGEQIAELVYWLTDVSRPEDGNRQTRKALDRAHIANAPYEAKSIKLADLIDNSRSITAHDPDFARVYMKEKRLLLGVLQNGHSALLSSATRIVEAYEAGIETA